MSLLTKWQQSAGTLVRDKQKCENEGHACLSIITRPRKGYSGERHTKMGHTSPPTRPHKRLVHERQYRRPDIICTKQSSPGLVSRSHSHATVGHTHLCVCMLCFYRVTLLETRTLQRVSYIMCVNSRS